MGSKPPAVKKAISERVLDMDEVGGGDDKASRMKLEVINEIIVTEEDYVEDLNILVDVFMLPIKFKGIIASEDINVLFRFVGKKKIN